MPCFSSPRWWCDAILNVYLSRLCNELNKNIHIEYLTFTVCLNIFHTRTFCKIKHVKKKIKRTNIFHIKIKRILANNYVSVKKKNTWWNDLLMWSRDYTLKILLAKHNRKRQASHYVQDSFSNWWWAWSQNVSSDTQKKIRRESVHPH